MPIPAWQDDEEMNRLLMGNRQLDFVRRILQPQDYPSLPLPGGSAATHLMASASVDGKNIAFPTVVFDRRTRKLKKLTPEEAIRYALQTGEMLTFDTPEKADNFARKYKRGTPMGVGGGY